MYESIKTEAGMISTGTLRSQRCWRSEMTGKTVEELLTELAQTKKERDEARKSLNYLTGIRDSLKLKEEIKNNTATNNIAADLKRIRRERNRLRSQRAMAVGLLRALVDQITVVGKSPDYLSVWTMAKIHGLEYKGPTYEKELEDARVFLEAKPGEESPTESDYNRDPVTG